MSKNATFQTKPLNDTKFGFIRILPNILETRNFLNGKFLIVLMCNFTAIKTFYNFFEF